SGVQSISFTLDSSKPATPNAVLSTDSGNGGEGFNTDGITNSAAITAPTNTENGAALEYRVQKGGAVVNDWSSSYSAPANNGTADGDYTVEVRQTDKAGNISGVQSISFTLDSTAPVLSTTTYAVPENNAANALVATLVATDANGPVTFSTTLSGADAAKFSIDAQGNLRVLAAKNFESKDDANTDGVYALTVSGTDKAGNSFSQAITVALSDVNEAPVVNQAIANQTFLAGGYSNSFTVPANSFTDVDAGTTFTYSATLADGSALPDWLGFHESSRTFTGSPSTNGSITVKVTATDNGTSPLSVSSSFVLTSVVPPTVNSFTVTDNNAGGGSDTTVGKQGDMLTFALSMSEAVTVSGSPIISVKVGGADITATYSDGSGSNVLLFTATAPAGDSTVVRFNSFSVNGGSVIGNTSGQSWASATV
ncbi:MAG: hypothetical protein EBR18_09540, partial [Betaproteobacteria bacterium]|nr:hypothetical protein [Betaproteobacteria bacterium]